MKRIRYSRILQLCIISALFIFSCDNTDKQNNQTAETYTYTVTFDDQAATTHVDPAQMTVSNPDEYLDALPVEPLKTGWIFSGWWTETDGKGTQLLLSTKVTSSITLYAYWVEASNMDNWDFEDWTSSNPPAGFSILTTALTMTQSNENHTTAGNNSAIITWTSTSNQDITAKYRYPVISGTIYVYHVWILDNDTAGRARLSVCYYDSDNYLLSQIWSSGFSADNPLWQELTFQSQAPVNAATMSIVIRFYDSTAFTTSATLYIDDLSITTL